MAENKIIDSLTFGDSNYTIAIPYGTCATAAATAAKAVTCANFIALETGASINVKFTYANSVANPTLNVNNTGAKSIVRYGTTKPTASDSTSWVAGAVVTFTYDGTYWVINTSPDHYTGDITGVTAGNGLTGGGSSGSVTLNVGEGSGITVSADAVSHADTSTLEGSYGPTANVTQSAKSTASIVVPQITVDGFGHVTGVTNRTLTVTDTNTDNNTWRKVQLNGTDKLGTGTSTNPLNIKAGKDMSITESSGAFTFTGETNFENLGTFSELGAFKSQVSGGSYTRSQAFKTIIGSTYFYGFLNVVKNSSGTITSYNVIMWGSATIYYLTYTVSSSSWSDTVKYLSTTDHTHGNYAESDHTHDQYALNGDFESFSNYIENQISGYAASDHTHDYSNTYAAKSHTHSGYLTSHQTIKQDGITGATVNRFGTCSTAAATAAKTVSITSGTFTLEAGARVTVKFTNANTASTPTLNVASKGAKNIFHKGAKITTGANKSLLAGTVDFVYDGTQWHLVGNYIDSDTTYGGGAGILVSGGLISNTGVRSITTGSTNGTISVNTNGTSEEVAVKGLGSSAYVTNWTAAECTTFTSDSGSCTPAAVKKAVGMFDPKAHTHSEYAASDHTHSGYVSTAELGELADDLSNHTHKYAGSSSAGGAATSANKVNSSLVVKLNSGTTEGTNLFTFNGSAAKTINITPSSIGAAASSVMTAGGLGLGKPVAHYYQSTATINGSAFASSISPIDASGVKTIDINARSATAGRYYGVEADKVGRLFVNVPWTNTTYSSLAAANGGTDVSLVTTGEKYIWGAAAAVAHTKHIPTAGIGLTSKDTVVGTITTRELRANLRDEANLSIDSAAAATTSGRVYPVALDKSGYLAVNVPWTNTTYTFNGAVSTIKDSNLTASRALISNSSGKVAVSAVTSTELGYLDGVTSNIQTQLNNKTSVKQGGSYQDELGFKSDITGGSYDNSWVTVFLGDTSTKCLCYVEKTSSGYQVFVWKKTALCRWAYSTSSSTWTDTNTYFAESSKLPSFSLSGTVLTITDNS